MNEMSTTGVGGLLQMILQDPAKAAKQLANEAPPQIPQTPLTAVAQQNAPTAMQTPLTASANPTLAAEAQANPQTSKADKFAEAAAGLQAPEGSKTRVNLSNAARPGLGGSMNPQIAQLLMQAMGGQSVAPAPTLASLIKPAR